MVSSTQRPLWAFVIIAITLVSSASAQLEYIQKILNPNVKLVKTKKPLEDIPIHDLNWDNWKDLLQDSTVDWLTLFTSDTATCPSCVKYEKAFNETVVALQDRKDIHFARVDCEKEQLLCNVFSAWGSSLYHITHTEEKPSAAVSADGMPLVHRTHVRAIPFHSPDAPKVEIAEPDGTTTSPQSPPDASYIERVLRKETWKTMDEWTGATQPFEGWARDVAAAGWFLLTLFGKIPPFVTMIGVSFLGRYLTNRVTNRSAARRVARENEERARAVGQAAKAK